jgi:hypothetical protein
MVLIEENTHLAERLKPTKHATVTIGRLQIVGRRATLNPQIEG